MDKLKLRVGDAEIIAIRSLPGQLKASTIPNRPSDVMFTLVDGRTVFLPMSVADRIYAAKIQPGQRFEIRKASMYDYQLKAIGAASTASTVPAAVAPRTAGTTFNGNHNPVPAAPPQTPPPPPPVRQSPPPPPATNVPAANRMMASFKIAIDAIAESQEYLRGKGLGITLTSDNITSAALSHYINECRNGGNR